MDSVMTKLSTSSRYVKYVLFTFNLLFVITGIILLSIGLTIHAVFHSHQHFLNNSFLSVPNLLIAIGTIIFFIAFFGCCGAAKESYCMMLTFVFLMVAVFILELASGISGYVLKAEVREVVRQEMYNSMPKYHNSSEIYNMWDQLQSKFHCCGTEKPADWMKYLDHNATDFSVPVSCCMKQSGAIGHTTCSLNSTDYLYAQGCLPKFGEVIEDGAVQLGGVGLGIAFTQAVGIWFAIYLARAIKSTYETV